jgi:Rrf2 family protein
MKVTEKSRIALASLVFMTKREQSEVIRLQDLASEQGFSQQFLEQIFRKLRMAGIVKSVRGPSGGYIFGKNPSDISVQDVLESQSEQSDSWSKNLSDTADAQAVSQYLSSAEEYTRSIFSKTSLSDLAKGQSQQLNAA